MARRSRKKVIHTDPLELHLADRNLNLTGGGIKLIDNRKLSVQIEHREGNPQTGTLEGVEVVYRDAAGRVLQRIAVAKVNEDGHIHANHREEIQRANEKWGIDHDIIPFFGEATKPKTPYEKELEKCKLALNRKNFGIDNYKDAIDKQKKAKRERGHGHIEGLIRGTWFTTILDYITHPISTFKERNPRYQIRDMRIRLAKEKREYNEMFEKYSEYFQISSNSKTREIEVRADSSGSKLFNEELEENKRKHFAQKAA